MECRSLRELGAVWAGCDFRDVPGKANGAVLFTPSGKLVPPTLEHTIAAGFAPSLAFISVTCRTWVRLGERGRGDRPGRLRFFNKLEIDESANDQIPTSLRLESNRRGSKRKFG
jgi:hypothetical protein